MTDSVIRWVLIDTLQPEPIREATAVSDVRSADHLRSLLEGYSRRMPRQLVLNNNRGETLVLSIGGPLTAVHYYSSPEDKVGMYAMAHKPQLSNSLWFTGEGQPTEVEPQYLLSLHEAMKVVSHIYQSNELPSWIEWEEG